MMFDNDHALMVLAGDRVAEMRATAERLALAPPGRSPRRRWRRLRTRVGLGLIRLGHLMLERPAPRAHRV
jgi:hypothetical protein